MINSKEFRHNHYVPEWYQKRFMLPEHGKYWYLDSQPEEKIRDGHKFKRRELNYWGAKSCFAEDDLYTVKWRNLQNVEIEKFFFGKLDQEGKKAVEYFSNFSIDHMNDALFHNLLNYMSVQKLRTPKGLCWLRSLHDKVDKNSLLMALQGIQNLYCAIWTECIWQIADALESPTKFIISDHPVTVYNRGCFPGSPECKGFNDPDIRMAATHTYFPLSLDKILIFTNLSWVRNPYQSEKKFRPNPHFFRQTIFNFLDIQTYRHLSEQEVTEINYITKKRALRYVAAGERDWLYPEKKLPSTHWRRFGDGLLLMPEPREIFMGGEIFIGYKDGRSDAFNEYGHRPWQEGYEDPKRHAYESEALERFKAEFALRQGPVYRGTSSNFHREPGPYVTPDEFHQHDVERAKRFRKINKKLGPLRMS